MFATKIVIFYKKNSEFLTQLTFIGVDKLAELIIGKTEVFEYPNNDSGTNV